MEPLTIATAQFQSLDGDKQANLAAIDRLAGAARVKGAQAVAFHELCVTAYTFFKDLDRAQVEALAEAVPEGPSTQRLIEIARRHGLAVLAGLVERDGEGRLYNTYVCVDGQGLRARFRKLHPFISRSFSPGDEYTVFELGGWQCGILICYDNNVIENVRAIALLGAQIIFAPHVTGCTPSPMPGRGYVDPRLWEQRLADPEALRREFDGPKGREWLLRWLPARAYDNGVYYAFSNPIGFDGDQLKPGLSMLLDPYGEILAECRSFDEEVVAATFTADKLELAGGRRYRRARRPELYREILGRPHDGVTAPVWRTPDPP
ncbi:MAG: nitrilase [Candidatus Latescibacteria bacterium]|nr:nitrilase [Candidatus Latescibacterota bacterium]